MGGVEIQNDLEVVKKMEDEHLRLQRQFRGIQTDRQLRTMGVHPLHRRQDMLLRILKKEYNNLNKDLKIARSGRHKKNDQKMKDTLENALLQMTKFQKDCEGGNNIMEELADLLRLKAKELLQFKKLAVASQGKLDERRFRSENNLTSAENKLEAAMLRFNAVQSENQEIREQIEHMLKDRTIFNQSWNKMLNALTKGKKFLSDLFESSSLAYDQRDEWCRKLRSIQEKGKTDQMLQIQEMRDLQKAYDHETKIFHFLAKKGVRRINQKQEERDEEEKRKKEMEAENNLKKHKNILEEIFEYTNETSVKEIVKNFERVESENFSKYKLLTDYCAENVVLAKEVNRIRQECVDRRDFNDQRGHHHKTQLQELGRELEIQQKKNLILRKKAEDQRLMINRMMNHINDMFLTLDCSMDSFQQSLGDQAPTVHTAPLALAAIEQKIKQYIQIVCYMERHQRRLPSKHGIPSSRLKKYIISSDTPNVFSPLPLSLLVPADPCPSCIESRWLSRVADAPEAVFEPGAARRALAVLAAEPAYTRSDRVHALADCRASASRKLLATRHAQY